MSRRLTCGALGLPLMALFFACAPAGDVVIPAAGTESVGGSEGAGQDRHSSATPSGAAAASETVTASGTGMAPGTIETPSPSADPKPTAQYATIEEFAGDAARFPFAIDDFPTRLNGAAQRFGTGIACPELAYSDFSEGYFGEITDTVFIHAHTPVGDGIYEISVGEIGAFAGKATAHDAFVQAALSVLGAVGDMTLERAMAVMDALHVANPAASGKAYAAMDQDGFRVTMEVRDGVDLRFAVHPTTPREGKQP